MNPQLNLPAITLNAAHYDRLALLAQRAETTAPEVARRLLTEIDRAEVSSEALLPPDVVDIGTRVTYRDNATGKEREIELVWPEQADASRQRVSIVTPVGAALLGLRVGQSLAWQWRGHEEHLLTVLAVSRPAG